MKSEQESQETKEDMTKESQERKEATKEVMIKQKRMAWNYEDD